MPNDLQSRCIVSPLKIKIPNKNMHEKPTNTPIIQLSISQKILGTPPEDGNVKPKHVHN
jgi:hypothetical protein